MSKDMKLDKNKSSFGVEMLKNWRLYSLGIPALLFLGVFHYWPMFGLILAFKDFNFKLGIFGSDWADPLFTNFEILVSSKYALNAVKNTLSLNFLFILVGTVCALSLAIMLNEIRSNLFKKIAQSVTFLPFFISWIVVGMFLTSILSYDNGILNQFLESIGMEKIQFYQQPKYWPFILTVESVWKGVGYQSIVYLAAITGLNPAYYEAAEIDGATQMQKITRITLPLLRPTVMILTLLALGRIMNSDFGLFWQSTKGIYSLWPTTDVIDTFIYRGLRQTVNIGLSSSAGFFQSIISLMIVVSFNWLARKVDSDSALY